jgi:signal transduction histidine kinase/FixJ family two-component response regulator
MRIEDSTILVVDDELGMRDYMAYMLSNEGYVHVVMVDGGQAAIQRLREQSFDLVITDLAMPAVNGLQVMEYIQQHCPDTRVIVITAFGSMESAMSAIRHGAVDYIAKPFDYNQMAMTVRRTLEKIHLEWEAAQRTREIAVLGELTRIINSSLDIGEVWEDFVREAQQLVDFDQANIVSRAQDEQSMYLMATAPSTKSSPEWGTVLPPDDIWPKQADDLQVIRLDESPAAMRALFDDGVRAVAVIPLLSKGEVIGTLNVGCRQLEQFCADALYILKQIADQVASAVEKARLFQKTQDQLAELKRTQAQLVRSARMAAAGALADGVAHEINNPLSVVLGHAQLLLSRPDLTQEEAGDLQKIVSSARRISEIIRRFTDFARPTSTVSHESIDVNRLLDEAVHLIAGQAERDEVRIVCDFDENLPYIIGSRSHLQQAFLNLFLNALEAIQLATPPPPRPEIRLTTRRLPRGVHIGTQVCKTGGVEVKIADTGCGISEAHLERIFEPGFTTKVENGTVRGLGIGLFVAYNVVESHQGTVTVESEVGKGSVFTIRLPRMGSTHNQLDQVGRIVVPVPSEGVFQKDAERRTRNSVRSMDHLVTDG